MPDPSTAARPIDLVHELDEALHGGHRAHEGGDPIVVWNNLLEEVRQCASNHAYPLLSLEDGVVRRLTDDDNRDDA